MSSILKILSELRCDLLNGLVFRFRNFEVNISQKENLHDNENEEDITSHCKLKKKIIFEKNPYKNRQENTSIKMSSGAVRALMSGALLCSALSDRSQAGSDWRSGAYIYHEQASFVFFKLCQNWAFFGSFC